MVRIYNRKPIPGDANDPQSLTALLSRYLNWMEIHHYSLTTVRVRRDTLIGFIEWCLDRSLTQAASITQEIVERYQSHLYRYQMQSGKSLSIATQCHRLTALRSWFTWLAKERYLSANPAREMMLPKNDNHLPQNALTRSEIELLLEQPDLDTPVGLRDRAWMETLYSTGIRRVELRNLELSDIDWERRTLFIRQGKGRKDRVVPIGDRALAWIDKYIHEGRPDVGTQQRTIFLTAKGRPMHHVHLSQQVRRYLLQAKIDKAGGCHLFRHSAATLMLEGGADIRYIQAFLGHQKLNTTQVYTHVSIDKLREIHSKTHPAHFKKKKK